MSETYRVFSRKARNWQEFASARKITIRRNCSLEEARRICAEFNNNRNSQQERSGTKYEFERE